MAKTELILIKNVVGLGGEADQVKVAPGYARNFLIPRGLAISLTGANRRRLDVLKQRRADREAHDLNTMSDLGGSLAKLTLLLKVKTGEDGKMFGAVTSGTIADELKNQYEAAVERRKIHLPHPLKTLGDHEVELRLHPQVHVALKVRIESTTPPPAPEPAPAKAGEKTVKHSEKFDKGVRPAKPEAQAEAKSAKVETKPAKPVKG